MEQFFIVAGEYLEFSDLSQDFPTKHDHLTVPACKVYDCQIERPVAQVQWEHVYATEEGVIDQ